MFCAVTVVTTVALALTLAVASAAVAEQTGDHAARSPEVATASRPAGEHQREATAPPAPSHAAHDGVYSNGAIGRYPASRDASGTAWQPDSSEHGGVHAQYGQWSLMGHLTLNGVYD